MKGTKSKQKADSKLSVKGAAAGNKPAKKGKAAKDPNKPTRPVSAFFVFMEEFRKEYKEKHPNNKAVSAVAKAGGEKWKKLSDADKAPFVAVADKRKVEYEKNLQAYNKKQTDGPEAEKEESNGPEAEKEESEKSKSSSPSSDEEESDEEDD